jgi:PHP family Zn ribbon phosphoesterase
VPQRSIVPLQEVIAEVLNVVSPSSKKVVALYDQMLSTLGSEFNILLEVSLDDIKACAGDNMREAISRVRTGNLSIEPGYDGLYGKVKIFKPDERPKGKKINQSSLF